jgi:alkanesulfonate monooxygenase SsuD/methylene tetrahydromethanopterin reductase-like flavin-dependent oxidoreductase (luciferase family)
MRFGFVVPHGDAADIAQMAELAEQAGWDGLFVWEGIYGVDAWIALGVAATRTKRLRLGTLLTPVSRRKPWELAGQVATVDRLSNGRVTLSVGLGAPDTGFAAYGEETDRRARAELVDEGLEIMTQLWANGKADHQGHHYTVTPNDFPCIGHVVQQPRPPVWCVGALGSPRSMRRELRWDGLLPQVVDGGEARQATLDELLAARRDIAAATRGRRYDVIVEGSREEHSPAAWFDAGATWWIESMWDAIHEGDPVMASIDRIASGPPVIA